MYRDELEAMQARMRTLEARLVAEQKQRIAAEAETRVAQAQLAEAKLATEQTAEKRVRLSSTSTIWILSGVLVLMVALGVGLFLRVQQHQERSAQQLNDTREALARTRGQLAQAAATAAQPPVQPSVAIPLPMPTPIAGSEGVPQTLGRSAIVAGMKSVKAAVQGCFDKHRVPGMASVVVTIARSGKVSRAMVRGVFAETPTGSCIQRAVLSARFPPFRGAPVTFDYPFILR
jgi:hypothetical protein